MSGYGSNAKHPSSENRKMTAMLENSRILEQAQNLNFRKLVDEPRQPKQAFDYQQQKQYNSNRQLEKKKLINEDRGSECKNDSDGEARIDLIDHSLADTSLDNTVRESGKKKLCKADLTKIRAAVEKVSKRAVAEIKFCNGPDEESDVVFDWCSQVVQTVLVNLPSRHAKLILKDGQEELNLQ